MLYQSCWNNLVTGLIVPPSLLQFVNSLFQTCSNKFGTSSANTSCEQLVNRLVTTCLQVCSNLCVFTCVHNKSNAIITIAWSEILFKSANQNILLRVDSFENPMNNSSSCPTGISKHSKIMNKNTRYYSLLFSRVWISR